MAFVVAYEEIGFARVLACSIFCRQCGRDNLLSIGRAEVEIDDPAAPSIPPEPGCVCGKFVIVLIMRVEAGNVKPDDRIGIQRAASGPRL